MKNKLIERKALKVQQRGNLFIYLLSLSGDELLTLAGISRVSRNEMGKLIG